MGHLKQRAFTAAENATEKPEFKTQTGLRNKQFFASLSYCLRSDLSRGIWDYSATQACKFDLTCNNKELCHH